MNKIELLAPAGDLEKLKWAIMYGADAVYLGGKKFSLRANATNFTIDEIKEGVKFAHEHNAKVYVTVNILFHEEDMNGLLEYLKELEEAKVDAIIVSDLFIIDLVKENNIVKINMFPKDKNIANLLKVISDFILFVKNNGKTSFEYLYEQLISYKMHIGLRKGLIPIFISIVFHEYKKYLIVTNQKGQVNINADTLLQINAKPKEFYLQYADWNEDKEIFIIIDVKILEEQKWTI